MNNLRHHAITFGLMWLGITLAILGALIIALYGPAYYGW